LPPRSNMEKIRLGMIGCGGIARGAHIPNYQKLTNEVDIVACADIDESIAKSVSERFGIPRYYKDYHEMLESEQLDAVDVCTPNGVHKDPTVAALNAGVDVLVEKPIARTAAEGWEMVNAARKNNKLLIVGFQNRFNPAANVMRDFFDSGDLGEVYYGRSWALRRRGIPGYGVFVRKEIQGGGPLVDIGVHILDLTLYVLGFPRARTAYGVTYTKFGKRKDQAERGKWKVEDYSIEDMALGLIRFENGLTLSVEASWASNISREIFNTTLMGDKGGAVLDPLEIYLEKGGVQLDVKPNYNTRIDSTFEKIKKFVDSVRERKELYAPGIEAVKVQAILDAIYESAKQGNEVTIKQYD